MTDPITDMLNRIRNSLNVRAEIVDMPHSKIKEGIARILAAEGYIRKFEKLKRMNKGFLRIALKYGVNKEKVIAGMRRVSKPGRRVYADARSLPRVQAGFGTAVISTSRGLLTDGEARKKKIGGEVVCYIW